MATQRVGIPVLMLRHFDPAASLSEPRGRSGTPLPPSSQAMSTDDPSCPIRCRKHTAGDPSAYGSAVDQSESPAATSGDAPELDSPRHPRNVARQLRIAAIGLPLLGLGLVVGVWLRPSSPASLVEACAIVATFPDPAGMAQASPDDMVEGGRALARIEQLARQADATALVTAAGVAQDGLWLLNDETTPAVQAVSLIEQGLADLQEACLGVR